MANNRVSNRKPKPISYYKLQLRRIDGYYIKSIKAELEYYEEIGKDMVAEAPSAISTIGRLNKRLRWLEKRRAYLVEKIESEKFVPKGNDGLAKHEPYRNVRFYHFIGNNPGASVQARSIITESSRPADMEDKAQAGFVYLRAVWFPRGNKYDPSKITKANECARRLRQIARAAKS